MVGSYPPKDTIHSFTTQEEDVPSGTFMRGTYTVHGLFTDDDKNEHLKVRYQSIFISPERGRRIIDVNVISYRNFKYFTFQWEFQLEVKKDWD